MKQVNIDNFKQKEQAQKIFGHGFQTNSNAGHGRELKLLALYLRDECKMKSKDIYEYLAKFCEDHVFGYHYRAYYRLIDAATKYAVNKGNVLVQIDSLPVYGHEIGFIDTLDIPYEHKKVMFSILMLKKLDKACYEQRHTEDYKMGYLSADDDKLRFLKKVSGVKLNIPKDVFFEWREKDLIRVSYAGYVLNFMEELESTTKLVMPVEVAQVKHFDCFGAYWDLWFKAEQMTTCKVCEKPIWKTKANICYCKEHAEAYTNVGVHMIKPAECQNCGQMYFASAHAAKAKYCPPCAKALKNGHN